MKIAFRVDSNKTLGMGHVNRCKIIAKNLQKNNIACIFLTKFKQNYHDLLSEGFSVFLLKNKNEYQQVNSILKNEHCSKIIIDTKRKSVKNLIKNLDKSIKTVLIDNIHCSEYVDLAIFSSVKNPEQYYPKNSIVGLKYILHGIEKQNKYSMSDSNSILLSMGGSDKYNITKLFISAFHKSKTNFRLNVILGKFNEHEKQYLKIIKNDKRIHLIKNPSSMAKLMNDSEIGIFTFGITVFEAAICKLPSFVLSHSNENDVSANLIEKYGWISYLGKYNKLNYIQTVEKILRLLNNKKELKKMTDACNQIDGLGPKRIANCVKKL